MESITRAPNSARPLTVNRLGYGAMRLTGPGNQGEPADWPQALAILQTAVAGGVTKIDPAEFLWVGYS